MNTMMPLAVLGLQLSYGCDGRKFRKANWSGSREILRIVGFCILIPAVLLLITSAGWAGAPIQPSSVSDPSVKLRVNAYGGAKHGTKLKVVADCPAWHTDCNWTLQSDGMIVSDTDPTLAWNAYGGAQHGAEVTLVNNCRPNLTDCTWTVRNDGLIVSNTNPQLTVNAYGGAKDLAPLVLVDNCAPERDGCKWVGDPSGGWPSLGTNSMVYSTEANNAFAVNPYGGAYDMTELQAVKDCPSDNTDCLWNYRSDGMVISATNAALSWNAYGGARVGTKVTLVIGCPSNNTDCQWDLRSDGLIVSRTNPNLAVKAEGVPRDIAPLVLVDDCTPAIAGCKWTVAPSPGWPRLGPPSMLYSAERNNAFAVGIYGGLRNATVLQVLENCPVSTQSWVGITDCLWRYRSDGMIISESHAAFAWNAYGGARVGTRVTLVERCPSNNTDCQWDLRSDGLIVSRTNPNLAVKAQGGPHHIAPLVLVDDCTPAIAGCKWTVAPTSLGPPSMVYSAETNNVFSVNAYGGATHLTELQVVENCPVGNWDCLWQFQTDGMIISRTNASLAWSADEGYHVSLKNDCSPKRKDCQWDLRPDGLIVNRWDPRKAVKAQGGPHHIAPLVLVDDCTPNIAGCKWTVAPFIDLTVATTLADVTTFLYTGPNPIQTGVVSDTINPVQVAVIRGRVLDKANNALSGARITILDHPEFGQTLSREDGRFDLAVNGGGQLTVSYVKEGYLLGQRQVNAPWQDYVMMEDTILIQQDTKSTSINLTDTTQALHVAQGSPVTDQDGTRQATLLIPQGTQAQVYNPDNTMSTVTSLNLRLTEYTAGANGQSSMPAPLPPSSAFTYAFEMRAEEAAIKRDGKDVVFDRPVPFYIDNFLNFPVGTAVPVGYYDQDKGVWVPSDNGKVIKILAVTNGTVDLDTDGDGVADDETKLTLLGINADEKARLAGLYPAGKSLWRVQVKHLSTWDCNWPYKMPDDAEAPKNPEPTVDETEDDPECKGGSIIECQNQILRESLPITGTGMTLNYASNRVEGRKARNTMVIQLTGDKVPGSLTRVDLEVDIAGRHFEKSFPDQPNQRHPFVWDGLDAFGRKVNGGTVAKIRIGYVYHPVYATPAQMQAAFALFSGVPLEGSRARNEIRIWQEFTTQLGRLSVQTQSIGGWALSHHHNYDPIDKSLYLGTGEHRSAKAGSINIISTVAGKGKFEVISGDGGPATAAGLHFAHGVALDRDGNLYIAENFNRVRRVDRKGVITTVAGDPVRGGIEQDKGDADRTHVETPMAVALGPDGSLYIADGSSRIRRIDWTKDRTKKDQITTVAGKRGGGDLSGDGGPAKDATLRRPSGLAFGPDGSLYIADTGNSVIRRVGLDGIINTVAGDRVSILKGDGGPATKASLSIPSGITVGPDGSLYIADTGNHRIRKVSPDGIITTVAGSNSEGSVKGAFGGDGGLATAANLNQPRGVKYGSDGSLYIADYGNHCIRRVGPDGIITTVAGNGTPNPDPSVVGDGGPATTKTQGTLNDPTSVDRGPDSSLYIADQTNLRVRRVASMLPGFSVDDVAISSTDGMQLYRFDARGRHLQTLNAVTGAVLYLFGYDTAGRLISVKDADGNTTTIERDTTGNPIAVVAPFGQRTALKTDANGYLASVDNPAGEAYQMTYTKDGLLTEFKDPKGAVSQMSYDELGRLKSDTDAAGGAQTLVRTETDRSYTVSLRTTLGRTTSYLVEHQSIGDTRRLTTAPDGTKTETIIGTDGGRKTTLADGTVINLLEGPDPRFSMQAPIPKSLTMITGGLTSTFSTERTVSLADPNKPLSLIRQTDTIKLNGRTFTSVYDAAAKTTTNTSAASRISTVTTDKLGRVVQTQVTGITETKIAYDTRGRLATITQDSGANGREAKFAFNAEGYLEKLTDPLNRAVSFGYDAAGRVTKQTMPDGRAIAYGYDANGNLTSLTPPGRPAHVFRYDKVDQTSSYEPPPVAGTGNTVYEYNLDKDLTKITRPDGQTLDFGYDTGGRMQTLTFPSGKLGYGYDATTGKLAEITAQDAKLTYTYNGALLTKTVWTGSVIGQVERAYDNDFRVKSLTLNGANPIMFQYDNDSLLTKAGDLTLTRNAQNGLLEGTGLVGVSDSYTYNSFGEVTAYEAKGNGSSLLRFEYPIYDKLSRISQKKEMRGGTTQTFDYVYDTAGRLAEVKRDGIVTAKYDYDSNGNRTHLNGAQIAHYDDQDRLLDYQGTTYQYSANGELQQKSAGSQVTKYDYDVLGNLKKVTLPNGIVVEYLIDGQNRRIGKKVGGTLTQAFLYQSQLRPIAELNGSGAVVSRFVYAIGINVPDYMIKGGTTYRIIKDHLGSPRLVVDVRTNTVAQELEYDAFGNVTKDTNPGFQPFGFAGGLYDRDTKLVRFGARDYDADTGRWTAKDPIRFEGSNSNLYGYALSDPMNKRDVYGLSDECVALDKLLKKRNERITKLVEKSKDLDPYALSPFSPDRWDVLSWLTGKDIVSNIGDALDIKEWLDPFIEGAEDAAHARKEYEEEIANIKRKEAERELTRLLKEKFKIEYVPVEPSGPSCSSSCK